MNIEDEVKEYCRIKNIPVIRGRISDKYAVEVRRFIQSRLKSVPTLQPEKVGEILKGMSIKQTLGNMGK